MRAWLAAIGLFSMLGQVVLLRELNVAFYGSELIYVLALGVWMVFTAAGAGAARWSPTAARVRLLLVTLAAVTAVALVLARTLRPTLSDVPGSYLSFPVQVLAMTAVLAPVATLLGLSFQWAARLFARAGRTMAEAYAIESGGGLLGGAMATLLMAAGLPNLTLGCASALATSLVALHPWRERPGWLLRVAAPLAAALAAGLVASAPLDHWLTSWSHPDLVTSRDTPYGRVTVTRAAGQVELFENDALAFQSHDDAAAELTHVAAVHHPDPERVLILGGDVGLVAAALLHVPEQIDVVDLNQAVIDLSRAHFETRALDADPVHVTIADPRAYLRDDATESYDLILVGASEPTSGLTNRTFTREMFAAVAGRLSSDGVLAFRVRTGDNLLGPHHRRRSASIHRALTAELEYAVVLPGTSQLFLASRAPLTRDPAVLADRLEARGLPPGLVSRPYLRYLYENDRFSELRDALATTDAPANSDGRPVCYRHTLLIWLSTFYPSLALLDLDPARVPIPVWLGLGVLVLGALALARRTPRARTATRVAIAGFVGMVLETAVILAYQSSRGALFGDLGLLLTAFMGGLTAASATVARVRSSQTPWLGPVLVGGLAATAAVVAVSVTFADLGLPLALLLLFATGASVAAVFAHATRIATDQETVVAPLYAADLAGGALASVLASLVLIPWLGVTGACLVAVVSSLSALSVAR